MQLTIITINKDNADGLGRTIESVLAQTYADFEFVIVDGASTDGSVAVINTQKEKREKVSFKWISEPDNGVYQAMNKGIQMASGEYLLFLNSGDYLVNNRVLASVFSCEREADILVGRCNVSKNGQVVHTTNPPKHITFGTLYAVGLAHQATFIKRKLFSSYGLYDESFRYNADIEFWYRTIILGDAKTETLDEIVSDYNLEGISSTECNTSAYRQEMERIFNNPKLQLFVPDYEKWEKEKIEMDVMYWVKSKALLYNILNGIYAFACFIHKLRKK